MNEQAKQNWAGFAERDTEIWRQFVNKQIPRLYGMFIKRWPNTSLAEELTQKTIFDAIRGCGTYDPARGSPVEWLFGIARNNIRIEIRKRANRPSVNGDISTYVNAIDTQLLPDEVLERKETAAIVRTALNKLESKEKTVLKAKYIEALSAAEIAGRMGITEKAVHSLLYRARLSFLAEIKAMAPPI